MLFFSSGLKEGRGDGRSLPANAFASLTIAPAILHEFARVLTLIADSTSVVSKQPARRPSLDHPNLFQLGKEGEDLEKKERERRSKPGNAVISSTIKSRWNDRRQDEFEFRGSKYREFHLEIVIAISGSRLCFDRIMSF